MTRERVNLLKEEGGSFADLTHSLVGECKRMEHSGNFPVSSHGRLSHSLSLHCCISLVNLVRWAGRRFTPWWIRVLRACVAHQRLWSW